MFCVVVHAVSVPDAVWIDDWKAFAQERSADVIVSHTPEPAEMDAPHASQAPPAAIQLIVPSARLERTCPSVGAVAGRV